MALRTTSKPAAPQIKPAELRRFHQRLAAWYQIHGRHDLPWRLTEDPYYIWLSEVMLQQTQVSTVLARFYHPFLEKFPTVEALAAAPREAVMKAWEGLGYYRRAGNLHEAARKVVSLQSPVFSKNGRTLMTDDWRLETLLSLPGIGRNTAHAIAAFAYHQPVAILEANVKRVVARIFALEMPNDKELWAGAEMLLNRKHPFDYNQAMMDLGSLICTPKKPACSLCPANSICAGKTAPERYPAPKAKKQTPTKEVTIHVREDASGKLFLERRDAALLGGLYGFPQSPHPKSRSAISTSPQGEVPPASPIAHKTNRWDASPLGEVDAPDQSGKSGTKVRASGEGYLGTVVHIYTHFKLVGTVLHQKVSTKTNSPDWYTSAQIAALPLSKLDHKVLALVENCHTAQRNTAIPARARRPH